HLHNPLVAASVTLIMKPYSYLIVLVYGRETPHRNQYAKPLAWPRWQFSQALFQEVLVPTQT
ncbi:MAG: hypothetical protein L0J27_10435, partial [Lactiplantibacillus plantarum]|nr:hypothetical protein [Lactiplantibacillus plantarum]